MRRGGICKKTNDYTKNGSTGEKEGRLMDCIKEDMRNKNIN